MRRKNKQATLNMVRDMIPPKSREPLIKKFKDDDYITPDIREWLTLDDVFDSVFFDIPDDEVEIPKTAKKFVKLLNRYDSISEIQKSIR